MKNMNISMMYLEVLHRKYEHIDDVFRSHAS
jgi:hypothetical protein